MVFFTCNHCGESLKKAAVEKHYSFKSCRNAPIFLTCVDCLKDFREKEYVAHTKCISEAERYSAKGFVAKPEKNKGAQKQEIWTECIQELAERPNFDDRTRNVLQRIATQSNVPRKKPKFINFLKSCMHYPPSQAEKIWTIIEAGLEEFKKKAAPNAAEQQSTSSSAAAAASNPESTTTNGSENAAETNGSMPNGATIESVLEHALLQPDLIKGTKKLLKKLQKRNDIPLNIQSPKKKKLLKFLHDQLQLDAENGNAVWECLWKSIQALTSDTTVNSKTNDRKRKQSASNDSAEAEAEIESKKTKTEVILADSTTDANGESTFDWQKHILRIFNKGNTNQQIPLELLKMKVIRKFLKSVGEDDSNCAQYEKKFKKTLKKIDSLTVTNGIVQQHA